MRYGVKRTLRLLSLLLLLYISQSLAIDSDNNLHIHVEYQKVSDTWKVRYELPIAVNHVAFSRQSNFDRRKLYKFDESKFTWDKSGDVLLIRSVDNKDFTTLDITFSSSYNFIRKDYTPNLKFTDGSVLLYTNHLALGANIIEDENISPDGKSFGGTQFHFYSPQQNIIFLGNIYREKAKWTLDGNGTYIYFGNILPIETDNFIAIVDPALPKWAWDKTQEYFPKLFDYYERQTDQPLSFKPVVFFNYDNTDGDYSNYSGGTLDGLVQLTINGKGWEVENNELFNTLFHFLAHEAAHFWNGQMFSLEDLEHSWIHEGGADAFANFAMMDFGLLDSKQLLKRFEEAANSCILNKGSESLADSAKLRKYRNYYTCGATMALASDLAVKASDPNKSFFDLWKRIFDENKNDGIYNQKDYLSALEVIATSSTLPVLFKKFSEESSDDNFPLISSWFTDTSLRTVKSSEYSDTLVRHWGSKIVYSLMRTHCKNVNFSSFDDYIGTYPINGCKAFESGIEIQYVNGLDIFKQGIDAYHSFEEKCKNSGVIKLNNKKNINVAEIQCLREPPRMTPYLKFETN